MLKTTTSLTSPSFSVFSEENSVLIRVVRVAETTRETRRVGIGQEPQNGGGTHHSPWTHRAYCISSHKKDKDKAEE